MLHLIAEAVLGLCPAPLHRFALRWAHRARVIWWRWRKPTLTACRVLAFNAEGQVLLVRHAYGSARWMPPGGGIKSGEDPLLAAAREFREELGCALIAPRLVAVTLDRFHGAGNKVYVVSGLCQGAPRPDQREIIEAGFFPPDALPHDTVATVAAQMPQWIATLG
jgi:8-oxo-dGTP pyrophosphatase MutT (NUDIX family)